MKTEEIKKLTEEILNKIGVNPKVTVDEGEESTLISIDGPDLNFLIGYRGESAEALQTMIGLINFKKSNVWKSFVVDINGYAKQKQEKIEQIAKSYIDKVRFFGQPVEMNPMSASERRQVHSFVSTYDDVTSESTGEGMYRRVVIQPKVAKSE